jgi:hypothetical protein
MLKTNPSSLRNINCMIVPTGIGASIGGYAGDANPACRLLAKASDLLITHPNVVNAALLTDIPDNVVVIDGWLLDRFFARQIALRLNTKHKIGVVVDASADDYERALTETCLKAARTVYGVDIIEEIFYTAKPVGANNLVSISEPDVLLDACQRARLAGATALAVLCVLDEDPQSKSAQAYKSGQGHDPIGKIEAKIAHLVSSIFVIPSAHAPILRSSGPKPSARELLDVSSKSAAEYLSESFLASVIKCLQNSAHIIPLPDSYKLFTNAYNQPAELGLKQKPDDIVVHDLSNLVVPYDSCNSVPMIEAWKHDVDLICVRNNTTDLDDTADIFNIPHKLVANYLEAAGYLLANTNDKYYINPDLLA